MLADTFIFLAVSQFLQAIMSYSHCSLHTKNCSRFFKWKTSGWRGGFFLFILVLFYIYSKPQGGRGGGRGRGWALDQFWLFYFHGAKMCCTSSNILHINWPEDSIKLIQSNLELWTEFLIVSSYSTLILRKIKRAVGTSPNYITCLAHTRSYTTYKLKGIIYYVSQDLVNDTVRTPAYPGHLHLGLLLLLDQLQTQQIVLVACWRGTDSCSLSFSSRILLADSIKVNLENLSSWQKVRCDGHPGQVDLPAALDSLEGGEDDRRQPSNFFKGD